MVLSFQETLMALLKLYLPYALLFTSTLVSSLPWPASSSRLVIPYEFLDSLFANFRLW
uniref:Uncharacterized protein n=1 Tax=Phakopsora pachyrhizi TaxID=170000 RepID=A0A0S1MJX1_PHAPC